MHQNPITILWAYGVKALLVFYAVRFTPLAHLNGANACRFAICVRFVSIQADLVRLIMRAEQTYFILGAVSLCSG